MDNEAIDVLVDETRAQMILDSGGILYSDKFILAYGNFLPPLRIDAAPDGKTISRDGTISDKIFTAGTALKGILWESTATPEIRAQANKLALSLLEEGERQ